MDQAEAEERARIVNEINRTVDQYNREVERQRHLVAEINFLRAAIAALIPVAVTMGTGVHEDLSGLAERVGKEELNAGELFKLLEELSSRYFSYKNLSTATKNLTQFNDEYFTVFGYYRELRRITLGYVIGLDTNIISSESARKKVEKAYLQNSEYWLTYCIAAVMLWAAGERTAAERGVSKALSLEPAKASLFFLLVNLRFARLDAAVKWYTYYLDKIDTSNLGEDWQYLLQAHLSGAFGGSRELEVRARDRFKDMIAQVQVTNISYDKDVAKRARAYADAYPVVAEFPFALLREYSSDFEELRYLLALAQRNQHLADEFSRIAAEDLPVGQDLATVIEETLYNLIEAMDGDEDKLYRTIKYNELIVAAKGDLQLAQAAFDERFPVDGGSTFGDLLMRWAFSSGDVRVSSLIRRFSISLLKEWIAAGFGEYQDDYRRREKERYEVHVDGWSFTCSEQEADLAAQKYEEHFGKSKWKDYVKDKFILMWGGACAVSLLILVFLLATRSFNAAAVIIAVLLGISGAFLLWRRVVDLDAVLADKKRVNVEMIRRTLKELAEWRETYKAVDAAAADLKQAIELFD